MTSQATTDLPPSRVLDLARAFFTGRDAVHQVAIAEESERHLTFETFRSRIVVAAFPDPRDEAPTRVRASSLREYTMIDQFLTYLRSAASGEGERSGAAGVAS